MIQEQDFKKLLEILDNLDDRLVDIADVIHISNKNLIEELKVLRASMRV